MMTEILRYAKVNSIKNEKVFLTGVNPPTGRHVTFVFERVGDAKTLESLNHAFQTGLFLKYLVGKNNMHFAEEKPPKEREDSYFTFFSYCKPYGYNPLFFKELDHLLVTMSDYRKPVKEIGKILLNVTEKLGNVCYAKDITAQMNKSKSYAFREIRYHAANAIIHSKACLDALAAILNEVYGLGYRKGQIDLATTRSNLLNNLIKTCPKIGGQLKRNEKWINRITDYRDFVVHRIMLMTPPLGQVSSSQSKIQIVKCKIPSKPITIGDEEKNILWIDAEDYCQELINELEKIVEIVCTDLLDLIRSKTFFPM
jgi:hypothetical protein